MTIKQLSEESLKKAWEIGRKNTKYNKNGQPVISRSDDDFEDEWEEEEKTRKIRRKSRKYI